MFGLAPPSCYLFYIGHTCSLPQAVSGFPSLHFSLKPLQTEKSGGLTGLTSFISSLSGITVLYCFIHSAQKLFLLEKYCLIPPKWDSWTLRDKAELWLSGVGGWEIGKLVLNMCRLSVLGHEKSCGDGWQWWLHTGVNVFNTTELYTLKWLHACPGQVAQLVGVLARTPKDCEFKPQSGHIASLQIHMGGNRLMLLSHIFLLLPSSLFKINKHILRWGFKK